MLIEQKPSKDFEPDPFLEVEREYEARIVGLVHIGTHEKKEYANGVATGKTKEESTAVIMFELLEEDANVLRGPEDAQKSVRRMQPLFLKYSSHEKSKLFGIAKKANPKSAWVDGKEGKVDTSKFIGCPVNLTFKEPTDDGKQYLDEVKAIPQKYQKDVEAMEANPFQYCVESGAFPLESGAETTIEDVPTWLLNHAIDKAVDAATFGKLEEIEDYLEAVAEARDGEVELDGDRLPQDDKTEPKKEEVKEEKKETTSRRGRRSAKKDTDTKSELQVELEAIEDVAALEDRVAEVGVTDDDFEVVGAEAGEDDDKYKELLIAKALEK